MFSVNQSRILAAGEVDNNTSALAISRAINLSSAAMRDARLEELEAMVKRFASRKDDLIPDTPNTLSNTVGLEVQAGNGVAKSPLSKGPLSIEHRATCRIMHAHGVSLQTLALKHNRSVNYIDRVVRNDLRIPDYVEADYSLVGQDIIDSYPPPPPTAQLSKKRSSEVEPDRRRVRQRGLKSGSSRSGTRRSDSTVVNQSDNSSSSSQQMAGPNDDEVLKFLQNLEPNMERLFPKFQAENFDNAMLREITTWGDDEINELLSELNKGGVMTISQRFIIKKGLMRLRVATRAADVSSV